MVSIAAFILGVAWSAGVDPASALGWVTPAADDAADVALDGEPALPARLHLIDLDPDRGITDAWIDATGRIVWGPGKPKLLDRWFEGGAFYRESGRLHFVRTDGLAVALPFDGLPMPPGRSFGSVRALKGGGFDSRDLVLIDRAGSWRLVPGMGAYWPRETVRPGIVLMRRSLLDARSPAGLWNVDAQRWDLEPAQSLDVYVSLGVMVVGVDGAAGLMDLMGRVILEPRFTELRPVNADRLIAVAGNERGVIDRSGTWLFRGAYTAIRPCGEGMWLGRSPEACDLFNEATGAIVRAEARPEGTFHNGRCIAVSERERCLIDTTGRIVSWFPAGSRAEEVTPGLYVMTVSGRNVIVDGQMRERMETGGLFERGVSRIRGPSPVGVMTPEGVKYGYMNEELEWVIPPQFDAAQVFHDGIAMVNLRGPDDVMRSYWIDTNGTILGEGAQWPGC